VAIIGGGLAGLNSAYAMARRGWHVKLIERHGELAQEASGNAQGMLYTKLSPQPGTLNQFTLSSYLYALRFYRQLAEEGVLTAGQFDFCGLLQLSDNEAGFSKLQEAFKQQAELVDFVDPIAASELAGINIKQAACYFPASGWLSPPALCQQLAKTENINILKHTEALSLEYDKGQWQINGASNQCLAHADKVIIANSLDALHFQQTAHLPLKSIRGQTTCINSNPALQNIRTVICHEGYLTPALNGQHTLGATFHNHDDCATIRPEDHRLNIESLHRAIPDCFPEGIDSLTGPTVDGRVGFRCNTPDYMPIAGAVPDHQQFLEDYGTLRKNAHSSIGTPGSYYPGLFLNIGHGSRGLTSTPLCAELLAALICNEPRPLPRRLWEALSPARFIIRDLVRNKL
jgi:tRNA 5-methylaminomethyl-2-thiouridine biosynthesis bifunctional protein